ncbi:hypothetical protein KP509_05G077300 [Ceratopteris richardii]|uniref:Uncharacterized protein n=1 Tax=Ceratopteris richardii TaxID=49495 RepID=A0A8T2UN04_CERRI|nr:hypothetical protein KP509_05G077300 [Ceratopteris richardii]
MGASSSRFVCRCLHFHLQGILCSLKYDEYDLNFLYESSIIYGLDEGQIGLHVWMVDASGGCGDYSFTLHFCQLDTEFLLQIKVLSKDDFEFLLFNAGLL